jgi:hypothetical protein
MIHEFLAQHNELRQIMAKIETVFDWNDDDLAMLCRERHHFSKLFHAHVAAEKAYVLKALDSSATRSYDEDIRRLVADYSAHVTDWSPPKISADKAGYSARTRMLQGQFLQQMNWEEREIFPRLTRSAAA